MTSFGARLGVVRKWRDSSKIYYKTLVSYWSKARRLIRPQKDITTSGHCPRADTVLLSLLSLAIFLIAAVFAIVHPTAAVKCFIVSLNVSLASVLGTTFIFDMVTSTSMYSKDPATSTSITKLLQEKTLYGRGTSSTPSLP